METLQPRVILASDPIAQTEQFMFWLADHGIPVKDCYRIEVFKKEEKIISYCYARNERGKFFMDLSTGKATKAEPKTIRMKRPIPEGD